MRATRLLSVFLIVLALGAPSFAAVAPVPAVPQEGPDVPMVTAPVATVTPFDRERWDCAGGARTHTIAVPAKPWTRVALVYAYAPDGDPWDRTFAVAIGGVELIHGTTPRTAFTIRKEITEFSSLLAPGGTADVSLLMDSYVGAVLGTVTLEFYDEPVALPAASSAHGGILWRGFNGNGSTQQATVTFPATAPTFAVVEVTMSGHGGEEFWYMQGIAPRTFHVLVDGTEIAFAKTLPYTYAFVGLGNENANNACSGPGTSPEGDLLHPLMWWTAQQALDVAGVHGGVGEIPPARALIVDPTVMALLTGERTVEVVEEGGFGGSWILSASFLLHTV